MLFCVIHEPKLHPAVKHKLLCITYFQVDIVFRMVSWTIKERKIIVRIMCNIGFDVNSIYHTLIHTICTFTTLDKRIWLNVFNLKGVLV